MLRLLIDENLSPRLARWAAEQKDVYAVAVVHVGLSGRSDQQIWRYAFENDLVVVTTNARDFLDLLDVDLHPGLIVLRESGLTREDQWQRLAAAIDYIRGHDTDPVNTVVEVTAASRLFVRKLPPW